MLVQLAGLQNAQNHPLHSNTSSSRSQQKNAQIILTEEQNTWWGWCTTRSTMDRTSPQIRSNANAASGELNIANEENNHERAPLCTGHRILTGLRGSRLRRRGQRWEHLALLLRLDTKKIRRSSSAETRNSEPTEQIKLLRLNVRGPRDRSGENPGRRRAHMQKEPLPVQYSPRHDSRPTRRKGKKSQT